MRYDAVVLADSISPEGVRLSTIQGTYPRFMHPEVLRNRVQSHSVMSSRAVPTEKLIELVRMDMFVPETFNKRVRGMGYGDALDEKAQEVARAIWMAAGTSAASFAEDLMEVGIDKSRANRLLEPFLPVVDIITATEWSNFFALRQPASGPVPNQNFPAQPEFQIWARMVRDAIEASTPVELDYDDWHLPKVTEEECREWADHQQEWETTLPSISAGRCAKVSFATHEIFEDAEASMARQDRLVGDAHWSPSEHTARAICPDDLDPALGSQLQNKLMIPLAASMRASQGALRPSEVWCGNLRGWVQLRKTYDLEHDRGLWLEQHAGAV